MATAFLILLVLVASALIVMALTAILNVFAFPRLASHPKSLSQANCVRTERDLNIHYSPSPRLRGRGGRGVRGENMENGVVFVLIPARDEAAVIGETMRALLAQDIPNLHVILLDDNSSDGTGEIALAAGDPRLRVIKGLPLPPGWMGKNWACDQLARAASEMGSPNDVLIFTDADVIWRAGALAALLDEIERTRADLLTIWPTQITVTLGERLVVPLMAFVILGYLPVPLVHHTPWAAFAAGCGQCLAFRWSAYDAIGGHAAARATIIEDIVMARRIKAAGLRLRMADGAGLIACRMYTSWAGVRDGYAKNIIAGYGGRVSFLILATVFHWLVFLAPWLWLIFGGLLPGWLPLALIALGVGVRALTAAFTRQRVLDALLMPISVLLMTVIAARAVWWQVRYGGPRWKGRTIPLKPAVAVASTPTEQGDKTISL
jgi:chlorobactene glucosyltransferase